MTMNEYQLLAQRTAKITDNPADKLLNGCMGLNGEAGECIDLLKNVYFGQSRCLGNCDDCRKLPIGADIAEKLGIKPIGGESDERA